MRHLEIVAGQRHIPSNPFVSALIGNILIGFASSLKGVDSKSALRFVIQGNEERMFSNGRAVELNAFAESVLSDLLAIFLKRLHAVDPAEQVEFRIGDAEGGDFENASGRVEKT